MTPVPPPLTRTPGQRTYRGLDGLTYDPSATATTGRRGQKSAVGLEPVSVVVRSNSEAWVANRLSDTVSIVDLSLGTTTRTLAVGDEPMDIAFAAGKAFVAVSQEDAVEVYNLADLSTPPTVKPLFSRAIRALAVSRTGDKVYAVAQRSGNQTTVVNANIIFGNNMGLDPARLAALGLNPMTCLSPSGSPVPPPPYPPLPPGVTRNPALTDPSDGVPKVGLIVKWNPATSRWEDERGQNWNACLPFRLPDHDLFVINTSSLSVTSIDHLGTTLFEVSVDPANDRIYVPNTEARNN